MSDETTVHLPSDRLAALLALGVEGGDWPRACPQTEPEALAALLSAPAPAGAGATLADALADPRTPLEAIEAVKRSAKQLARQAEPEPQRAAATAVYYAAIAHAIVHHARRISAHGPGQLAESFADLASRPWIPAPLRDLFTAAGGANVP